MNESHFTDAFKIFRYWYSTCFHSRTEFKLKTHDLVNEEESYWLKREKESKKITLTKQIYILNLYAMNGLWMRRGMFINFTSSEMNLLREKEMAKKKERKIETKKKCTSNWKNGKIHVPTIYSFESAIFKWDFPLFSLRTGMRFN